MTRILFLFSLIALILSNPACRTGKVAAPMSEEDRLEWLEDSVKHAVALKKQAIIPTAITAVAETREVYSNSKNDDAADDPAIWVNIARPEKSLVFGSNKKGGIEAYDLSGKKTAFYPVGSTNNIDILYNFPLNNQQKTDILGGTNRFDQSLDLFSIDPVTGQLTDIADGTLALDTTEFEDLYGFCFYNAPSGHFLFVNGKNGLLRQYALKCTAAGKIAIEPVRSLKLTTQVEGVVADETNGILYIGEEDLGIWKWNIEAGNNNPPTLIAYSGADNPNIAFDIEGLALCKTSATDGYLIASSQGNYSYAIFDLSPQNRYIGSFKVTDTRHCDGSEETDGLDITTTALGKYFPNGLLVVQDGFNYEKGKIRKQNFKYIDLGVVLQHIEIWQKRR